MQLKILQQLEDRYWPQARRLYHAAFAEEGRKPDAVIERMFDRGLSELVIALNAEQDVIAMAIVGTVPNAGLLILDYLAVRADLRGRRVGKSFVEQIIRWSKEERLLKGLLIEAESDPTAENQGRIRFWESCGFISTAYIHHYIWVPEPYRALYLSFEDKPTFPVDGQLLFQYISAFHRRAFRPVPETKED